MYVNIPATILKRDRLWNDYEIAHAVCVKPIGPLEENKKVLIFIRCIVLPSRTRIRDFSFETLHQVAHFSVCRQKDYISLIPKFQNLWRERTDLNGYDVRYCSERIDLKLISQYLQTLKLREGRLSTGDIALSSELQKAIQGPRFTRVINFKKHAKLLFEGKYEQFSGLESLKVDDRGQLLYSPDGQFHSDEVTAGADFDCGKLFPVIKSIACTKMVDKGFVVLSSMREFYSICEGIVLEFEFKNGSAARHGGCVFANTCAMEKLITFLQSGALDTKAIRPTGGWIRQYDIQESQKGFLIDRPLLTQPSEYCDKISYHVGLTHST